MRRTIADQTTGHAATFTRRDQAWWTTCPLTGRQFRIWLDPDRARFGWCIREFNAKGEEVANRSLFLTFRDAARFAIRRNARNQPLT